jgi:hypothetical protein
MKCLIRESISDSTKRAGEGTRTLNPLFTRQVRYRLRHSSRSRRDRIIVPSLTLTLDAYGACPSALGSTSGREGS